MRQIHTINPIFNSESKVLILGSFPSVKSRKENFYYAHPQNKFWKIMECLFNEKISDKKQFLLDKKIALWDTIKECTIEGSSDSSIKDVIPNDINYILSNSNIKCIFTVGNKSYELYNKYIYSNTNIKVFKLSSPSPANASMSLEKLVNEYKVILEYL